MSATCQRAFVPGARRRPDVDGERTAPVEDRERFLVAFAGAHVHGKGAPEPGQEPEHARHIPAPAGTASSE